MTSKEIIALVEAEEKRLGVNSPEFLQRHNEIMDLMAKAREGLGESKRQTRDPRNSFKYTKY